MSRLRRILRLGLWAILALGVLIQLKQVDRSNPPIRSNIDAPAEIEAILRRSCYDCHSHETRWPWYSYVAPVSWLVADDVEHARGDLNFSEWPLFDPEEQEEHLEEIREEVSEDEMPLTSYRLLHPGARLSEADKLALMRWTQSAGN